jgi:hypothetical protein
MKVLYFQTQTRNMDAMVSMMREIDPMCPTPEPLEGGDGNGVLFQCILDERKKDVLLAYNNPDFKVYSRYLHTTEIDDKLYKPECYVKWRFGGDPTITTSS